MLCKTCNDKGLLLKPKKISEHEINMVVVTCDCCGGWSTEGIVCENCLADAEGKPRPFVWVDEKDYSQAMEDYQKKMKRGNDEE